MARLRRFQVDQSYLLQKLEHTCAQTHVEDGFLMGEPAEKSHMRREQRRKAQEPHFWILLQVNGGRLKAKLFVVLFVLKGVDGVVEESPVDAARVKNESGKKRQQALGLYESTRRA